MALLDRLEQCAFYTVSSEGMVRTLLTVKSERLYSVVWLLKIQNVNRTSEKIFYSSRKKNEFSNHNRSDDSPVIRSL